jgi:glycosyltransferase involved in cell wall biosynthesis
MLDDDCIDVLIVTTAHDAQDGRLIRHQNSLQRNGLNAEIMTVLCESRLKRFLLGPFRAYRAVKIINPQCVILPDPELHLFLAPLLSRRCAVISDVHEDYFLVLEDRKWVSSLLKPLIKTLLKVMPKIRNKFSDQVVVASHTLRQSSEIVVENIPHIDDLERGEARTPMKAVYVGDIGTSRGMERMFTLLNEIPNLSLELVGPCKEQDQLVGLIQKNKLHDRVIWHNRLSYYESWKVADRCSVGICLLESTPAYEKAIPSKVWEYWALGLPVVVSGLYELSSLVRNVNAGFVLEDRKNFDELRVWLGNDEELYESGKRGEVFFKHKSLENMNKLSDAVLCLTERSF